MNDPSVRTDDLARAIGVPVAMVRIWLRRAGPTCRATGKGGIGLLAALTGILTALRQETATARAFRPAPISKLGDRLDDQIATLTADLTRLAEGRENSPVAEEIDGILRRLPGHRRRAMREARR